ncbi:MAG: CHASE2 domain-containing protein, partial [Leptolyngbyaceae bacterium]|nr:CHASE2 domain-containing protein [Leptolyngbyaceae bacterium]
MVFASHQHHITKRIGSMVLLTSVAVAAVTVGLRYGGLLEKTELEAYDRFMRLKPREAIDERVLVVGVEESDIQTLQEYPLHDGTLAQALEILDSYNPRAIGLDIARDVPQGPPQGRVALTDVLSSSDRIVSACLLSSATQPGVPPAPGTAPDLVGFADFPEDIGGVIRRSIMISVPSPPPVVVGQPHLCNDDSPDNEVLSLSFLLGLIYLEAEGIFPDQTEWGALTIGTVVFDPLSERSGGYASTGAFDYQVMLNYRSPVNAVRQVSLVDVLEEQVDPSWIDDRVVLIGYT